MESALIVVGPNGSGKSSIIDGMIRNAPEGSLLKTVRMVNADTAEEKIEQISTITDPLVKSREAQKWCDRERKALRGKLKTFGYETVGSHPVSGERHFDFMEEARTRGYYVELIFVSTENPEINLHRIARRVAEGGHNVNPDKVVSRYQRTMSFLPQFIAASDVALIIDNSIEDAPYRGLLRVYQDRPITQYDNCKKVHWIHTYYFDKQSEYS